MAKRPSRRTGTGTGRGRGKGPSGKGRGKGRGTGRSSAPGRKRAKGGSSKGYGKGRAKASGGKGRGGGAPTRGRGKGFGKKGASARGRAEVSAPELTVRSRFHFAEVVPGFERVAEAEVREACGAEGIERWRGRVVWDPAGPARDLLELRCTEDVFAGVCLLTGVGRSRFSLGSLYRAVVDSQLEWAVSAYRECHPGAKGHRIRFRVIALMAGRRNFVRSDLTAAVERALVDRSSGRWVPVPEDGMELWVDLWRDRCLVGLRLSTERMRQREGRSVELPAALRPSAAACLVRMSGVAPGQVFLDPCCGSGTILSERLALGDGAKLIGTDIDPDAVVAARLNVGRRAALIVRADASRLPLPDGCVDAACANLPFGQKVQVSVNLPTMYAGVARELSRVLKRGARAALLVGDPADLAPGLERRSWRLIGSPTNVNILGRRASAVLLERK